MEWLQLDSGAVTEHGSRGLRLTELARFATTGEFRTYVCEVQPGGVLGRHQVGAGRWQLFTVVAGAGWVSGPDLVRHAIGAGQAVLWAPGESHEAGSESGMTAVMVMAAVRPPSGP